MVGPLQRASTSPDNTRLDGEVRVADGVAFADGIVLTAAPGCRIILSPGVCVGRGVIVQASRGDLVVEPGAVLGRGVLIVGHGRIGQNACIGADSTLINPGIPANQVVSPKTLLGDPSQPQRSSVIVEPSSSGESLAPVETVLPAASPVPEALPSQPLMGSEETLPPLSDQSSDQVKDGQVAGAKSDTDVPTVTTDPEATADPTATVNATASVAPTVTADSTATASESAESTQAASPAPVHGQHQVQQLLATLFPHRQPLNGVSPEDRA